MRITRPKPGEPIRLIESGSGQIRYRVVLDAGVKADGRRRQVTRTFARLADARAYVAATRTAVAKGTFIAADRQTFNEVADRWLAAHRDIREVSRANDAQMLKYARTRMGERSVQSLTRSDFEGFVSWLQTEAGKDGHGVGHRSITLALQKAKAVLNFAMSEGLVGVNRAAFVKAPRRKASDSKVVLTWTEHELNAFKSAADLHEWAAGWRMTLSGLRRSEVLGMTWAAVDMQAGTITVRHGRVSVDGGRGSVTDDPKAAASWRTLPVESMHPGSVAILRALRARQAGDKLAAGPAYRDSGYVLVDALGGPIRHEVYSDRFARLCRVAGVPVINPHAVRHSLATVLHEAGVSPAAVAALLGHTLAEHLTTYVKLPPQGIETAGAALQQRLALPSAQ
jgi:integrase